MHHILRSPHRHRLPSLHLRNVTKHQPLYLNNFKIPMTDSSRTFRSSATAIDTSILPNAAGDGKTVAPLELNAVQKLARNVFSKNELLDAAVDQDRARSLDYVYSNKLKKELKATSQKSSGRCWMFAALNLIRQPFRKRLNLKDDFEFSQAFLFFYDKMERANYFLEQIIDTREEDVGSRVVSHLLSVPFNDGGQWDMFHNLIVKYGVVPKSVFPETVCCTGSRRMNWLLTSKARQCAMILREKAGKNTASEAELQALKADMLKEFRDILVCFFGVPPTKFDWTYQDGSKKYKILKDMTPYKFFHEVVNAKFTLETPSSALALSLPESEYRVNRQVDFDFTRYISLVHDPRNPYNATYTVDRLGNVVKGERESVLYLNVDISTLKKYTMLMLNKKLPVWFGCDVGKYFHRKMATMDTELFDFSPFLKGSPKNLLVCDDALSKADRLRYGDSLMTHAMVFTGYDLRSQVAIGEQDDKKETDGKDTDVTASSDDSSSTTAKASQETKKQKFGEPLLVKSDDREHVDDLIDKSLVKKWRVENSWGSDGANGGYYIMSDEWFDEFMFQIACDRKVLTEEHQKLLSLKPTVLPPWDPMGALAKL